MKKHFLVLFCLAVLPIIGAQAQDMFTVPRVENFKPSKGTFNLSSKTDITVSNASLETARGLLAEFQRMARGTDDNTIALKIVKNKKLGKEGYRMTVKPSSITIEGQTPQAVVWGVQTLLQQWGQGKQIPCGVVTDAPAYPLRGFMIDVGRKYIPLDYLYSLVRDMSYYKMNCLQVHLNDNGFKKYFHNNWDETYAAFRIESELFPELTARDGYYSKKDFHDFIQYAEKLGVEIIPEIDAPAHALAFTHYRPSLGSQEFGVDHLDLTNPAVTPFLDSLWNEYLGGPDPVFCCPRVHIGTDEYNNKKQDVVELFRALTDHLIKKVQSYGKQPVMWGALTHAQGETPVQVDGVLMDMWYNGYADPKVMHEAGYQMVSIPDGWVYIVPAAGYYYDYLNDKMLYESWTPANIGGVQFAERDPQIQGGMFAVWNDVCGNGISVGDVHHRIFPAMQVMAEKCWHAVNDTIGYADWNAKRRLIGEPIGVNELGTTQAYVPNLKPNEQIGESAMSQIGYDYQVDFDITWGKEMPGATLTLSPRAKFYLCDPISGFLGFSRDGYLFTFNYSGRAGRTEHITIQGTNKLTRLLVNGKEVQTLGYDQRIAADMKPYDVVRTLVFPLQKSGNFKSSVTNFVAKKL